LILVLSCTLIQLLSELMDTKENELFLKPVGLGVYGQNATGQNATNQMTPDKMPRGKLTAGQNATKK